MSTVGIDFGNDSCRIAVVRKGGIDVIVNEVSRRETPTVVGFSGNQRFIGESGATQQVRNLSGTVNNIKRIIGRKYKDNQFQEELKYLSYKTIQLENEDVGIQVNYDSKLQTFSNQQILATYFKHLNKIVETENQSSISEAVISVPVYFNDYQRRAIINSATIAGYRPLRLISEPAALGLHYGFYKTDFNETPVNVMFVDVGHSATTVSVISFTKDKLKIVSTVSDSDFGGRNFDQILANHFNNEFKKKYGIDISTNNRAKTRLLNECEKAKKTLSANAECQLSIECIMNDIDAKGLVSRSDFEDMSKELVERFTSLVNKALTNSNLTSDKIVTIELVGGASRIPMLQQVLKSALNIEISHTMNKSESISRGCALQCAMLSSKVKAREFVVQDCLLYPIQLSWNEIGQDSMNVDQDKIDAFEVNSIYPNTRLLTLNRKDDFELQVRYTDSANLPVGSDRLIGKFTVSLPSKEETKLSIKLKIDADGIFSLESVQKVETVEVEEEQPTTPTTPSTTEATSTPATTDNQEPNKKKRKVKRTEISFSKQLNGTIDKDIITSLINIENKMTSQDRLIHETSEAKNQVESYVYDTRSKLSSSLASYASDQEKSTLLSKLEEAGEWLYGDGEDAVKEVYVDKLLTLKKLGDPIEARRRENELRQTALDSLNSTISKYLFEVSSKDPKYDHIDQNDKQRIATKCAEATKWIQEQTAKQSSQPLHLDPVLTVRLIEAQQKDLEVTSRTILSKPKPKPPVIPTPTTPTPSPKPEQSTQQTNEQSSKSTEQQTEEKEPTPMEEQD